MTVPEGFKPIAVRDDRLGICVISYNHDLKEYFLMVNGKGVGTFNLRDLKSLKENLADVIELKGRFVYIESYNADGTLKE
jgi:hypothetical protein